MIDFLASLSVEQEGQCDRLVFGGLESTSGAGKFKLRTCPKSNGGLNV